MKIDFTRKELEELSVLLQELNQHLSVLKSCYKKSLYMSKTEREKNASETQEKINNVNQTIYKIEDALECPFDFD